MTTSSFFIANTMKFVYTGNEGPENWLNFSEQTLDEMRKKLIIANKH